MDAKDALAEQYQGLVSSIAGRFFGRDERDDLIGEGRKGLIEAIDKFDASKGVKFSTYATHFIVGEIRHYLRDKSETIRVAAWNQELCGRIDKFKNQFFLENGREPTTVEIAAKVGKKPETVEKALELRDNSQTASLGEDEPYECDHHDWHTDREVDIEKTAVTKLHVHEAISRLNPLEQLVVRKFHYDGYNKTEIAKQISHSANYVMHILRDAERKMKSFMMYEELLATAREGNGCAAKG